jgi:hypothetical protein
MSEQWIEREALGIVKTYPTPSAKHIETVCVAAITREEGWVRLYPIRFRSLPVEQQFKKYQLIRLRMKKHAADRRPESFRPDENSMRLGKVLGTRDAWRERWKWIRPTLGPTMCGLRKLQKSRGCSLGCVKVQVDDFIVKDAEAAWSGRKQALIDQLVLFDPVNTKFSSSKFGIMAAM